MDYQFDSLWIEQKHPPDAIFIFAIVSTPQMCMVSARGIKAKSILNHCFRTAISIKSGTQRFKMFITL